MCNFLLSVSFWPCCELMLQQSSWLPDQCHCFLLLTFPCEKMCVSTSYSNKKALTAWREITSSGVVDRSWRCVSLCTSSPESNDCIKQLLTMQTEQACFPFYPYSLGNQEKAGRKHQWQISVQLHEAALNKKLISDLLAGDAFCEKKNVLPSRQSQHAKERKWLSCSSVFSHEPQAEEYIKCKVYKWCESKFRLGKTEKAQTPGSIAAKKVSFVLTNTLSINQIKNEDFWTNNRGTTLTDSFGMTGQTSPAPSRFWPTMYRTANGLSCFQTFLHVFIYSQTSFLEKFPGVHILHSENPWDTSWGSDPPPSFTSFLPIQICA